MHSYAKRFFHLPVINVVMGIVCCLGILAILQRIVLKPILHLFVKASVIADGLRYFISAGILLIIYYYFVRYYEKRKCSELDLSHWKREIVGGLLLGFGCISFSIFILYVLEKYQITYISTHNYNVSLLALLLLAALIEDVLIRGLVLRIAEQRLGSYLALLLIVSIESLHLFNDNIQFDFITMLFLLTWGFNQGILYIYTKRVWLPFAFHVGWNFAQPFYGSNLTGQEDMGKIIHATFTGSDLITGGVTGIENSVFTITILLATGLTFLYLSIRTGMIIKVSK